VSLGQQADYNHKAVDLYGQAAKCNNIEDSQCLSKHAAYNQCLAQRNGDTRQGKRPDCLPICQETVGGVVNGRKLLPAPFPGWDPWKAMLGASCDVRLEFAQSKHDGRNEYEVKFRLTNLTENKIAVRFDPAITSAKGEVKRYRNVGATLNPKTQLEGGVMAPSLSLGRIFQNPVYQVVPTRLVDIKAANLEVADLSHPKNPNAGGYLRPFLDFPVNQCGDYHSGATGGPKFLQLTRTCADGIPNWTKPACDDAVEEIIAAYNRSSSEDDKACILEWRKYQKCYEPYAFSQNPRPVPQCIAPTCKPSGN
jgi:hypothetical protein